jgi:hypothetical protein
MATRYVGIDDSNVTLQMGHPVFRIEAHDEIGRSEFEGDCGYSGEKDAVALLDVGEIRDDEQEECKHIYRATVEPPLHS